MSDATLLLNNLRTPNAACRLTLVPLRRQFLLFLRELFLCEDALVEQLFCSLKSLHKLWVHLAFLSTNTVLLTRAESKNSISPEHAPVCKQKQMHSRRKVILFTVSIHGNAQGRKRSLQGSGRKSCLKCLQETAVRNAHLALARSKIVPKSTLKKQVQDATQATEQVIKGKDEVIVIKQEESDAMRLKYEFASLRAEGAMSLQASEQKEP